jgi:hypothetical protein
MTCSVLAGWRPNKKLKSRILPPSFDLGAATPTSGGQAPA